MVGVTPDQLKRADSRWAQRSPPQPKVAKDELRRVHQLIEEESERIDAEDWAR